MIKFFRSVSYIINYRTLILTSVSVVATWYCVEHELFADFPLTLVGIAIVFPIVFSINSAYRRRERALRSLAEAKGNALGIYQTVKNQMGTANDESTEIMRRMIVDLFESISDFLHSPNHESEAKEKIIYERISEIAGQFAEYRKQGLAGRFVARMNQYLTRVMVSIDHLKIVFYYRTPRTLRAYSKVFIYLFPVLYAPYFASTAIDYTPGLSYIMPVLFSFILVSLDNIQEHLEDPYDQIGEDDIKVDVDDIRSMLN